MKTGDTLSRSQRTLIISAFLSLVGWPIAAQFNFHRFTLVASLAFASFMVGSIVGFLLTSYGEEAGTVGKVRDWVVGGITAITIIKVGAIKDLLLTFAAGPGPNEYALSVAVAITYSAFGFLYMFLQRELILNILLAESRAERGRLEGTREASLVVQGLLIKIPPNILSGSEDVDAIQTLTKTEAIALRAELEGEDVTKFLRQAEDAIRRGNADWQVIVTAANLHCYRTYFEDNEESRMAKATLAVCWIERGLLINPKHVDLTVKKAALLGEMKKTRESIATLEMLNQKPEAPYFTKEWLGYYLLECPERLEESIQYSESYHALMPEESDALFNIAAAYGRKYCAAVRDGSREPNPKDRVSALSYLRKALESQPDYAVTVRDKWMKPDGSFGCLADDSEFLAVVASRLQSGDDTRQPAV
jgi:tetratricopeptide (TPR) repeat protein